MHPPPRRLLPLAAALDQVCFFLAVFLLTYGAMLLVGWWVPPARYAAFVLFCLPLVIASAIFAAQLSRMEPRPVPRRNRLMLREVRPQEQRRALPRRAA